MKHTIRGKMAQGVPFCPRVGAKWSNSIFCLFSLYFKNIIIYAYISWLSTCIVIVARFLPNIMIIGWIFLTWDQFFLSYAILLRLPLICKQILVIDGWGIYCEIALIQMSLVFTDHQSTLVQVMAWCHWATSHYPSQCWPRSLSSYGVIRPEWVNWCYCISFQDIHHHIIVFCNISWMWTEYENNITYMQFWCTQNYLYIICSHL